MNHLEAVRHSWDQFAESDPMEAVMTGEDWDEEAFYATGQREIDALMKTVRDTHPDLSFDRALDFGCGLGRLSFGLSQHFQNVIGVDISSKMLEQASANRRASKQVEFILNEGQNLSGIHSDSCDFVLSLIVLQHIPRKFIKGYLREFLRVVKPGGLIAFQLPTRKFKVKTKKQVFWEGQPLNWDSPPLWKLVYRAFFRFLRWMPRKLLASIHASETWHGLYYAYQRWIGKPVMQMNTLKRKTLERLIAKNNGTLLRLEQDSRAGEHYESHLFFVLKQRR